MTLYKTINMNMSELYQYIELALRSLIIKPQSFKAHVYNEQTLMFVYSRQLCVHAASELRNLLRDHD